MAAEQQQHHSIVTLCSSSGNIFEVAEPVAMQSGLVRNMIQDMGSDNENNPIPLPIVSTNVLQQVLQFCQKYARDNAHQTLPYHVDLSSECSTVIRVERGVVHIRNLFDLIAAADYMHIDFLLHRLCCTVALVISQKTFEDIKQIFNSNNAVVQQRAEGSSSGPSETQILASLVQALQMELQLQIKIKVGQRYYLRGWSHWDYHVPSKTLVVHMAYLYDPSVNMQLEIAIILLHIDIGLVNTVVLRVCGMVTLSKFPNGRVEIKWIEWVDQVEKDLLEGLVDAIDMTKIDELIFHDGHNMCVIENPSLLNIT